MSVTLLENIKAAPVASLARNFPPKPIPIDSHDPLDSDRPGDLLIVTTERRLRRLMIVAADAGARFEREGIEHDPAAWMLAPREVFEGARPIDACQSLDGFTRGVLLHGLSLGLDADPAYLDDLLANDYPGGDDYDPASFGCSIMSVAGHA